MWEVLLLYFIDVGDSAAGLFSSRTKDQASQFFMSKKSNIEKLVGVATLPPSFPPSRKLPF